MKRFPAIAPAAKRFLLALAACLAIAACTRSGVEVAPRLDFVEVVTGEVDPETPLPLFVGIHGFGDTPEAFSRFFAENVPFPARFVFARGPETQGEGFAWFPLARGTAAADTSEQLQKSAARIVDLGDWLAKNRPTLGAPVVFGFSQGGMLSFAIVASGGGGFRAAIPIAGFLPKPLWPEEIDTKVPIRAFHGSDDPLIAAADAQATAEYLRSIGVPADVVVYDGVGHSMSAQMSSDILATMQLLALSPISSGTP